VLSNVVIDSTVLPRILEGVRADTTCSRFDRPEYPQRTIQRIDLGARRLGQTSKRAMYRVTLHQHRCIVFSLTLTSRISRGTRLDEKREGS
jgi:hypothetical protein